MSEIQAEITGTEYRAQQEVLRRLPRRRLFIEWVLAHAVAGAVGGFLGFPLNWLLQGITALIGGTGIGTLLADGLMWALIGLAQWFVLQRYEIDVQRGRWVFLTATVAAGSVTLMISMQIGYSRNPGTDEMASLIGIAITVATAMLAGFIVALGQFQPGRLVMPKPWWGTTYRWAIFSAVGMALGTLYYTILLSQLQGQDGTLPNLIWDFATVPAPFVIMTLASLFTGAALIWPFAYSVPQAMLELAEQVDHAPPLAISDRPWSRWRRDAEWERPVAPEQQPEQPRRNRNKKNTQPEQPAPARLESLSPARPGLPANWWRRLLPFALVVAGLATLWYAVIGQAYAASPTNLAQPDGWVYALDFSPDGQLLAVGLEKGFGEGASPGGVQLWNIDGSGGPLDSLAGSVRQVDFSPDGRLLAVGFDGDTFSGIEIWDVSTVERVQVLSGFAGLVRWSPDGSMLAASTVFGLGIWETENWTQTRLLEVDGYPSLSFAADNRIVVVGLQLWDVTTGRLIDTLPGNATRTFISPDGRFLAAIDVLAEQVEIWGLDEPRVVATMSDFNGQPQTAAWTADSQALAIATGAGEIRVWNSANWQQTYQLHFGSTPLSSGPRYAATAIAWSPDGKTLAIGGNNRVDLWRP